MDVKVSLLLTRNNYATLFDMITKNLDKVTKPKGENDGGKNYLRKSQCVYSCVFLETMREVKSNFLQT